MEKVERSPRVCGACRALELRPGYAKCDLGFPLELTTAASPMAYGTFTTGARPLGPCPKPRTNAAYVEQLAIRDTRATE